MTTFGLVHGAWHGAWCWDRLIPELERLGHRAIAVDLPGEDPGATFSSYADLVVAELEGQDEEIVLVGHSLAGFTVPIAAASLPVRRLVFLCALIAAPGRSFAEQVEAEPDMLLPDFQAGLTELHGGSHREWVDFDIARESLYGDCDEATAEAAYRQLRPQALAPYREPCPLEALPDVECAYVMGSADRLVNPEWSRRAAPERLGVEPVELPGSSHSPFLSRPAELARLLDGYA